MRRTSSKAIIYAFCLVAALVFLAYSLTSTGPQDGRTIAGKKPPETHVSTADGADSGRLLQAAPSDADFARYQAIVDRDVFSLPKPSPPPAPEPLTPSPIVFTPEQGREQPKSQPPPSLTNWSYVGYITIDSITTGIIQNDETDTIRELTIGEKFQGYQVEAISRDEMGLSYGATKVALKRPLDFPIVPLEGTAGATQPGRPQPGARRGGPPER